MSRFNREFVGWLLIILGIIIIVTPFTPGSILLVVGADMVFGDVPEWQRFKNKFKKFFRK